jgi:hypothetical protein
MFEWAPEAAESISYFAEKVPSCIKTCEYDPDVVLDQLTELKAELIKTDDFAGKVAAIDELLRGWDITNEYDTRQFIHDAGIYDGCDMPTFSNWTENFLWCREAVRWFFRQPRTV